MNITRFGAAALAAAVFIASGAGARAVTTASHGVAPLAAPATFSMADPNTADAQYCRSSGGAVEHRVPAYNTNSSSMKPTILAGSADFCVYTSPGKNSSSIHVLLSTLNATQPTLAALAYYARVSANCTGGGNPASCYCSELGGTDLFGGINAAGGAWVGKKTDVDVDLDTCIFPDLSSIDSFGLFYLTAKPPIYRGINLAKVLKFKNPFKK
jgi:hypothetical protein